MLSVLAAVAALAAQETVRSDGAAERTLTIYRDGLAYVVERHEVSLPQGRARVVLAGVNPRMVPQTAVLLGF